MFIKAVTREGATILLNVDHIKSVEFRYNKIDDGEAALFFDVAGALMGKIESKYHPVATQMEYFLTSEIVPVGPGFWLLHAHPIETGVYELNRVPIIAFRVYQDGASPTPITADECGNIHESNDYGILMPNGAVDQPYVATYDNEAAFLESFQGLKKDEAAA